MESFLSTLTGLPGPGAVTTATGINADSRSRSRRENDRWMGRECGHPWRVPGSYATNSSFVSCTEENEDLSLAGKVIKESIDFLTRQIKTVERVAVKKTELQGTYGKLLGLPGVGKVLGLTIMLETGPISRFARVGNYASYCRKVATKWLNNEKKKGKGNKKSGNKYLAWAFSEAAEIARRTYPEARTYYQRKRQKTNAMVAHQALAHKLARAAYYIMRDGVDFMPEKLFAS